MPPRAGGEIRGRRLLQEREHAGVVNLGNLIVGRVAVLLGHEVFVVEQTGSVVQEMANGDGLSVGGELGEDLGE